MTDYHGKTKEEVMELLQQFDWNWDLVADHVDGDANELKEQFGADVMARMSPTAVPNGSMPFSSAHIRPEHLVRLKQVVQEDFMDSLPILFNENMPAEQREEITNIILLEMGLTYKLSHAPALQDAYKTIEDEAFLLAKWREQLRYLTIIEDVLFKISVRLTQENDERTTGDVNSE
jgi:hypothetical protein